MESDSADQLPRCARCGSIVNRLRHAPRLTHNLMKSIYALLTVTFFASPVFAQAPAASAPPLR